MKKSYRIALLGSALTAATFFAGAPAQAACVVTPPATPVTGTVVCGTTLTTDTTYAGVSPSVSRNYEVDTSTTVFNGSVAPATAAITGFGLAFTNTVGGANALNVVNNGVIQINTGNTAASGGDDALSITAIGSTPVNYSGAGSITNNSTTGGGLQITSSGTGNITANVGGNVSTLGNDYAVRVDHNGTAGNIVITTAAGTTLRGGFGGVAAFIPNFNSGTISITNNAAVGSPIAALNTFNFGVVGQSSLDGAVTVINNGAVGLATDRAQSVGVYGAMFGTGSTQTLSVSGTGAVFSAAVGVQAINIGLGMTTVNYSGAVNSTGARGIDVRTSAPTAATSVTTGAGAVSATGVGGVGINVAGAASPATVTTGAGAVTGTDYGIQVATTGVQTINANGVTTGAIAGIHSNTTALRTINVGTAGNVTGTTQSILLANTGGAAVNNSGIIGAGATGLAINAASATAPITVTNNTGATINGRLTLGAGADLVTNAGTINTQGVSDFGAGADVLTNSGTYNTTAATTLLGLETLNNSGTLNANFGLTFDAGATALTNTGTLNSAGTIDFGAGVDSFANSGAGIFNLTASTTLAGLETFSNSGRINLNTFTLTGPAIAFTNTGTIDTNGSATLAGFTSLTNAGTIDLAAGTFTGPAAFTNNGTILADEGASTISGQTNFANSGTLDLQDGATGDVLTINSAFVGSGGSNLLVDFDQTTSDRLVINGAASGSTRIDANYLGAGLINLNGVLVVDALSASANAFVLGAVGGNTSPLVDYSLVQNGGDFLLVSAPNASAFDPLALTNFGPSLWYQSADEVIAQTRLPAATVGASFWGQVYLSRDKYDNGSTQTLGNVGFDVDQNLRTKRRGIQLGVDYGFGGGRVGLTAGYARAKANDRGVGDVGLKASGWNLGVYGQFGGVTGFHGEFLAKHDRYNADFNNGAFDGVDTDVRANGVDGSLGYRFGLGGDATLDANAGVSFVRTKFDDVAAFGFGYDLGSVNSTRGRAGLRATFGGRMSPYIDGTVYREFRGDGRVALFDGANTYNLENDGKATWFRAEAGILPNPTGLMLAAWADLGDRKGLGARLGFRFGGDAVAAPPPPPPPPPPPVQVAPATQTCLDGSVILATDSCPLPPPPPPPPPPAPERG